METAAAHKAILTYARNRFARDGATQHSWTVITRRLIDRYPHETPDTVRALVAQALREHRAA